MAINTQTIRIDLNPGKTIPVAFVHQNDTNRQLTFQLYNNGEAFTPSNTTVKFAYKSPIVNGQYSVITGSQMASGTVSGNTVTVTLPAAYTQVSGVGLLTMILTTSGNTLRPVNIKFVCQSSADGDDSVLGASDWPEGLYDYMDNWLEENEPTEIANLKSDLNKNSESVFGGDSIQAIPNVRVTENGYVKSSMLNYWKGLILPLDVCLVDGKITTLITGLSGSQSGGAYATLYFDGDHKFISGSYTAIPVNNSISESDIPVGTKYVGFNYGASNDSLFRIKSNTNITRIKSIEEIINEQLIYGSRYEIPLYFGPVTGYWNSSRTFTTYSGIQAAKVNVSSGETYYLSSKNYYGMARVAFFDSSDAIISVIYTGGNTSLVENTKVVVPQNASYMLIQRYGTNDCFMWKCNLSEHLSIIDSAIENIKETTTSDKTEDVSLTFESATGFYTPDGNISEYGGVTTANVSVSVGEEYLLNSRDYYSAAMVVFFDSNNTFISGIREGTGTTARNNYRITVPNGASKMLIQRVYTYRTTLRKIIGIQAKPVSSILNGKNITIIGDSITEKNSRAMTNWADYFADWCGANVQNLGASGTGFIAGGNNPYSNRISRISNPDIIGVACSFNDMSNSVEDLTTAAESFFDALITAYPSTPIICYVQSPWSAYHYGVSTSDAWVSELKEVCNTRGIPFYDGLYRGCTLKPWIADNRDVYYINDGEGSTGEEDWVHPNSEGHKIIARHLYPKFAENIVATGLDYLI